MIDGETQLIEAAIRGESSAFGALYDHYAPKIYRFIVVKVTLREEAEDLTHQVFLHAWLNISSYRRMGHPFSSWLYRIARNQVIDHYRIRKTSVSLEDYDTETIRDEKKVGDDLLMDADMEMSRVMQAMRALKDEQQDVLMMRFVEDLSTKEVAAAIQKSEGAVKVIQHRALKQLKELLEKDGSN